MSQMEAIEIHTPPRFSQIPLGVHEAFVEKYQRAGDLEHSIHQELVAMSEHLKAKRIRLEAETEELLSANDRLDSANQELKEGLRERLGQMETLFQDLLYMGISADRLAHVPEVLSRCKSSIT